MKSFKKLFASFIAVITILSSNAVAANAEWTQSSNNWCYLENGGYVSGWQPIDGLWYYFDSNGYMQTGWQYIDGDWYYLYSDGSMAHDCYIDDCYLNGSGQWITVSSNSSSSSNSSNSDSVINNSQVAYLSETGEKYHSIPNCGKMNPNRATKTTVAEAEASGHSPCTKCW